MEASTLPHDAVEQSEESPGIETIADHEPCPSRACLSMTSSSAVVPPLAKSHHVKLFGDLLDPSCRYLVVSCRDQASLLFKLCELLASQGIDIRSAVLTSQDGVVNNTFELQTSVPANFNDAFEWCKELDDYLLEGALKTPARDVSLPAVSKQLSVNPDLLSVVAFEKVEPPEGSSGELRYHLELAGINQAGLLAYASVVFVRSGFMVVHAQISTIDGQFSDTFELSATSANAEQLLRHYLDVPSLHRKYSGALPFQVTGSDPDLVNLVGGCDSPSESQGDATGSCTLADVSVGETAFETASGEEVQGPLDASVRIREAGALPSKPEKRCSVSRHSIVKFQNGDEYSGAVRNEKSGKVPEPRRHGFGTYSYSNHATFKLYRGHWHEDQKHGYGVLFYRNGSAYAGQWEKNKKHGLGVLLGYDGAKVQPNDIPSYRYEGEWCQDMQHGLGVEESSNSVFFGHFQEGSKHGRGVCANTSKTGLAAYEALDGSNQIPLLECLEREVERLTSLGVSYNGPLTNRQYDHASHEGLDGSFGLPNESRPDSGGSGSSGPSSSGKTSCDTGTPTTPRREQWPSPSENQRTPALKPGSQRTSVDCKRWNSKNNPSHALGKSLQAPSAMSLAGSDDTDETVNFALVEENNLLDDSKDIDEIEHDLREFSCTLGNACAAKSRPMLRQVSSDPTEPKVPLHERRKAKRRTLSPGRLLSDRTQSNESFYAAQRSSREPRMVLASPMLWSEDELAAFLACLGINADVCRTVQGRPLKGANQLVDMSNSEMRKQLGLRTPVERLVVRYSLKRLMEADRFEHRIQNQKSNLLGDSVLRGFLVPSDELRLIGKIGQGGFGVVFRSMLMPKENRRCLQANKQHIVAAKEMTGERRQRLYELLKEANVMASLHHPNICNFIGVCADRSGKKHYIVSELMDCSLFDLVHQQYKLRWHGDLSISLVVDISLGICAGVTYLHSRSLVHADLKSSNILIDYSTSAYQLFPRICDFGHAAVRPFPAPHHRLGTPHWAAPEALRSEALSQAADVYSFGVMLWEMLAQKLPHRNLNFAQVLAAVGWAGWTPDLSDLPPEVPIELIGVLEACFSFSAASRPTAKDVGRTLRRIRRKAKIKAFEMLSAFVTSMC